ncbi:MAG: M6 family metalloprotease domain-containing protein [Melioribacteraceae bacterium]|nr:M6 family metalloprotease domain-containing protein [Melioribacteraceae bacterium]
MGALIRSIVFVLIFSPILLAQMPPHPRLLENPLKTKFVNSFLESKQEYEKRGIDAPWSMGVRKYGPNLTPTGNYKIIVLLVNFPDKGELVAADFFDALLFNKTAGSLWDFYKKTSYNTLDLINLNSCISIGWVTVSHNYDYYVNNNHGLSGDYPKNAQKIVEEAVLLSNSYINFSDYDNDGDGYVDGLFVVHTGTGAEYSGSESDIWSHAWSTYDPISVDGKYVSRYAMMPEYWENAGDMTIGVFAHELGHSAFGLPDLYDRDNTSYGLGYWSLMSYGSWNGINGSFPAFPDAWSRLKMGFGTISTISQPILQKEILNSANNSDQFFRINSPLDNKEYFLLENKSPYSFDRYLPSSGLMIYHIDENIQTQNDKEWYPKKDSTIHYLVALEQADGLWELEKKTNKGNAGDPFPGNSNNTQFNFNSTPSSYFYAKENFPVQINNISFSNYIAKADFEIPQALTINSNIKQGWNIISLPLNTHEKNIKNLLNDPNGKIWLFDDGYLNTNLPQAGYGYWYKSPEEKVVIYNGFKIDNKINVKQGWNLIGSLEQPVKTANINSIPADILFSKIYSYDGSYDIVTDLEPGKGYWAKFSQNGEIKFNYDDSSPLQKNNEENHFLYSLVISNNSDISSTLHLSSDNDVDNFELPPLSPEVKLDVRFDNNGFVERANNEFQKVKIISDNFPLRLKSSIGSFEVIIRNKSHILNQNDEITIDERIENILIRNIEISNDFEIYQNYPNPFNGSTKISFSLPKGGEARIEIFNLLGERIFFYQRSDFNAGFNSLEWDAANFSSGIYLYKISSGRFSKINKMVVLK